MTPVIDRVDEGFGLDRIRRQGDRLMVGLLWVLAVYSLALAPWHGTWWEALLIGVPMAGMGTVVALLMPGSIVTRIVVAALFMGFSALTIHQSHGMIEMHFSVFGLLAFLLYYRDWVPIVAAAGVIAVHHLAFDIAQRAGHGTFVFNHHHGLGIVLVHAGFVVFETVVLCAMAIRFAREAAEAEAIREMGSHLAVTDGRIDLTFRPREGVTGFARDFNSFVERLEATIAQVHELAAHASSASDGVSRAIQALSADARHQAESLAQTASSIEQVTASVKQNAGSARQATELASTSRELAERGGAVVGSAVSSMQQISSASTRIAEIIGVIDEIAFQTNLLALNAAVEAARAGEQGRGFAVVAAEVRNLSQRTSAAAKEIKTLIGDSVTKVRDGAQVIERSGRTLEEIVEAARRVEAIVGDIAAASAEQSAGIDHVNRVVAGMDRVTRSSADRTEQLGRMTETLAAQAASLQRPVDVFAVRSQPPAARPAAPRPPARGHAAAPRPEIEPVTVA